MTERRSRSSTRSCWNTKSSAKVLETSRELTLSGRRHHHLVVCSFIAVLSLASVALAKPPDQEAIHHHAEFPEEDSDMLMEPNDFAPITVLRSHEQHFHMPPSTQLQSQQPQPLQNHARIQPRAQPRQFQVATQQEHQDPGEEQFRPIVNPNPGTLVARSDADSHTQAAQNFYPPFYHEAPPLGHSRPYFGHGPVSESTPLSLPLPLLAPQQQQQQQQPVQQHQQRNFDASILGSGDFGVLRGGTFYPEEEMPYHPEDNSDYIYGDAANNGHGRPSEGFVQKYTYPEEQFANFRDFADINTPADSAFSQFVVVYAAKNATAPSTHPHPKNIFEQLELLDREKELEAKARPKASSAGKSSSKAKAKLAKTKLQKKYRKKVVGPKFQDPQDPQDPLELEPLLALS
ncbi:uncharacterized protein [Drosophila kikkawai]|uniref:Uncharacterized protein LOC108080364 n=1 Tax=Drosophila kikkawai TaxID=30033 RepID=A0A6P4J5B4_DROKI|nr:uncharacterized protein LOC108080364 [Drosophila kikkawai]XP_017030572.1 uncharacterized protein LOC108080364 [Drosophila kikkawai]